MNKRNAKLSHAELVAQLQTKGWDLVTGSETTPLKNCTLEELVRIAHARHKKGEASGLIKRIESALELDLIEIQQLWAHLGLPM
jgi:hypothetical protein